MTISFASKVSVIIPTNIVCQTDVAAMANKSNEMDVARRQLLAAMASAPTQLLRPLGWSALFVFAKTFIPGPLLNGGRSVAASTRSVIAHGHWGERRPAA